MRVRLGLVIAVIIAALISPIPEAAHAVSTFPSAPNSVTSTAISGGVRVGWSAPTDLATGITAYRVEYSTSGTSGSWTQSATVSGTTYSYDILGLQQVATYIRVIASASGNFGTYGYPWTKIYGTTALNRNASGAVDFESGFGVSAGDPSVTKAGSSFTRIKYRLDTTISGNAYYAETDFYNWSRGSTAQATSRTQWDASTYSVIIPTLNSPYLYLIQANVTDMNVYSTSPAVTSTSGSTGINGRLEIWPYNYGTEISSLADGTTTGDALKYDFNDTPDINNGGSYGSFQVHDIANYKPVFVWNNTGYGATAEVAYGKNTGNHPDWTFCSAGGVSGSCPTPSNFRMQIYVNIPVTPLADATPPTVSRVDSKSIARNGDTITVQSSERGYVYLIKQSVSVTTTSDITGAAANVMNSVAIISANTNTVLTMTGLSDGVYNLYAVDSMSNKSSAIVGTITMDSTAPTFVSASIHSSGFTLLITLSENVTHSGMGDLMYTVSDGGAALTVGSVGVGGNVVQVSFNRSIPAGAAVTFSYAPTSGSVDNRWRDAAGNELAAISQTSVTNNSSATISISLTVPATLSKGSSTSISISAPVAGKVNFMMADKRIAGCIGLKAAGSMPVTVSCTFKPSLTANRKVSAELIPTNSSIASASTSVQRFILRRATFR